MCQDRIPESVTRGPLSFLVPTLPAVRGPEYSVTIHAVLTGGYMRISSWVGGQVSS